MGTMYLDQLTSEKVWARERMHAHLLKQIETVASCIHTNRVSLNKCRENSSLPVNFSVELRNEIKTEIKELEARLKDLNGLMSGFLEDVRRGGWGKTSIPEGENKEADVKEESEKKDRDVGILYASSSSP